MSEAASMKPLALGPTGRYTASAVARVRASRGMTFQALSDRLSANGWPIPVLGLRRIEACARRVSVDDLMALSAALEISPLKLLLSDENPADAPTGLNADMTDSLELQAWARSEVSQNPRSREEYWMRRLVDLQEERSEVLRMEETATYKKARLWAERARARVEAAIAHAEARVRDLVQQDG